MLGLLSWILFGALIGWVASLVMGTDSQQGALANIVIGVLGALVGGFLMSLFGYNGVTGFNLYSVLVAMLGAIAVISMVKLVR